MKQRMPVVFYGHGRPMIALEDNAITSTLHTIGERIAVMNPKAILSISAHWFTKGTFTQSAKHPRQIYDMYGFPKELYEVKYPVNGSPELAERVIDILGDRVSINDSWGIDHGTWTVLVHMFPKAEVPVVQLSVNGLITPLESYALGERLSALRDEGVVIFGSGNVVHNLRLVDWDNEGGTRETLSFSRSIIDAVKTHDYERVINYSSLEFASYAVPTPEHFLPLLYVLGAAGEDEALVFNDVCNLGTISMAGFAF